MNRLIAAVAALLFAGQAQAADFAFNYTVFDGTVASGTISATDFGGGFYGIDDITGTRGTQAITGYDFFDPTPQSFTYNGLTATDVDFSYYIGALSYELRWPGNFFGTEFTDPFSTTDGTTSQLVTSFTLAPAVVTPGVPEPTAWAMMLGGLGAVGSAVRRRRSAGATATA